MATSWTEKYPFSTFLLTCLRYFPAGILESILNKHGSNRLVEYCEKRSHKLSEFLKDINGFTKEGQDFLEEPWEEVIGWEVCVTNTNTKCECSYESSEWVTYNH